MGEGLDLTKLDSALRTEFLGRNVFYHESLASTMEAAQGEAKAGAAEGTTVIAEEQTAGRGRLGRSWVSPPGVNLYVTVIFRPTLQQLRYLAVVTPLAICLAIEETTGLFARIKWPNDVLINGKKAAGVLPQSELEGDEVLFALIGHAVEAAAGNVRPTRPHRSGRPRRRRRCGGRRLGRLAHPPPRRWKPRPHRGGRGVAAIATDRSE